MWVLVGLVVVAGLAAAGAVAGDDDTSEPGAQQSAASWPSIVTRPDSDASAEGASAGAAGPSHSPSSLPRATTRPLVRPAPPLDAPRAVDLPVPPRAAANPCATYRTRSLIDSVGRVIAKRNMWGAEMIHTQTVECAYYSDARVARAEVVVSWRGNGETQYALSGTLELTPSDWRWTEGQANAKLAELNREWSETKQSIGLLAGAAAAWWLLSQAGDDDERPARSGAAATASGTAAPRGTTARSTTVVCLSNRTGGKLYYSSRWSGGTDWISDSLLVGAGLREWNRVADTLQVRLDVGLDDDELTMRTYDLAGARVATSGKPPCQSGSTYELRATGNTVRIVRP